MIQFNHYPCGKPVGTSRWRDQAPCIVLLE